MKRYIQSSTLPYEIEFVIHSIDKTSKGKGYDEYTVNYTNGVSWKKRTYDGVTVPHKVFEFIANAVLTERTDDEYMLYEMYEKE